MIWMKSRVWPPLARRTVSTSSAQAGQEAVVPDAQQRPARHVADPRRLDHQHAGPAAREALVPGEDLGRDEALVGGAPGHHRRHPGALRELERAEAQRR